MSMSVLPKIEMPECVRAHACVRVCADKSSDDNSLLLCGTRTTLERQHAQEKSNTDVKPYFKIQILL